MKKEIIGYRLIKPEYYKAASIIMYGNTAGSGTLDNVVKLTDIRLPQLGLAGVLDLWFEPVYKEKEFEFGRWYKGTGRRLYFIVNETDGHGFDYSGDWRNLKGGAEWKLDNWQPATDAEVKERLLAYAKDKYVVGTIYKSTGLCLGYENKVGGDFYHCAEVSGLHDLITDGCGGSVFSRENGWAEIISEPEKDAEFREAVRKVTDALIKLNNLM